MKPAAQTTVDYLEAARRHWRDAHILHEHGSLANAGQLYGFCIECVQKELLLACSIQTDREGGVKPKEFRQHLPDISDATLLLGEFLPDGRKALHYCAMLSALPSLGNWSVDQRYQQEAALPLADLAQWQQAAQEAMEMMDEMIIDGVIYGLTL